MLDKIKAWFKHSVTILWARLVAVGGLLVAALQSDPSISAAIQEALNPRYVWMWLVLFGLVTELCRRRTAGKQDA